jgi:hypothetical protein
MSDLENPSRADPARRRLVRGVFAAPAVMTVFSGRALAQTSATCFAKNAATTVAPMITNATTDTWFRVRVWRMGTEGNYVKVSEVGYALQLSFTPFTYGGASYIRLRANSNYDIHPTNQNAPASGVPAYRNRWVLLRFNEQGKVIGFGGMEGSPMSTSCWTSFLA